MLPFFIYLMQRLSVSLGCAAVRSSVLEYQPLLFLTRISLFCGRGSQTAVCPASSRCRVWRCSQARRALDQFNLSGSRIFSVRGKTVGKE